MTIGYTSDHKSELPRMKCSKTFRLPLETWPPRTQCSSMLQQLDDVWGSRAGGMMPVFLISPGADY